MLSTIGYIVSAAVVLVAISLLQRERQRARDEHRPQNPRLRGLLVVVMVLGLAVLLFFTLQR
jgi:heme/copper-type cytochrome/quinol oxidase subunit 2